MASNPLENFEVEFGKDGLPISEKKDKGTQTIDVRDLLETPEGRAILDVRRKERTQRKDSLEYMRAAIPKSTFDSIREAQKQFEARRREREEAKKKDLERAEELTQRVMASQGEDTPDSENHDLDAFLGATTLEKLFEELEKKIGGYITVHDMQDPLLERKIRVAHILEDTQAAQEEIAKGNDGHAKALVSYLPTSLRSKIEGFLGVDSKSQHSSVRADTVE